MNAQDFRSMLRSVSSERPASPPGAEAVRQGLPVSHVDALRERLGVSTERIEALLAVSARTLQRRRARGEALTAAESDRLWRLLYIYRLACTAFGTEEGARDWLTAPHALLGGESPLARLDTEPGLREVEDMLTTIDETAAA